MFTSLIMTKLFSPVGRVLSYVGAVLFTIWFIYQKGKSNARMELENKSFKEARDAVRKANAARSAADIANERGGLLTDDGFKRD